MAEAPDRQELMTALTTEHFTLQGARSQTASESASRASLYILSVSSTLVALGFIGQASQTGDAFDVFALTVLPTLYVLGVFTFVRVVECGAEDFRYGVAINRIRNYYKQIAGDQAKLFLLSGHDDGRGVFENAAVPHERRKQFFTFATVVAVINSVVGGSAIAIALGAIADASLGWAAGVGGERRSSPWLLCSVTPTDCSRSAPAALSRSSRRRRRRELRSKQMRALVQRVSRASVDVDGNRVAEIGPGLLVLLGITHDDTEQNADKLAGKVQALRVFPDEAGVMNLPLGDERRVLCVSQFTLYGDTRKGNQPAYIQAARPEQAEPLYDRFCERLNAQKGVFGAHMDVELVNDGPVTLLIEVP